MISVVPVIFDLATKRVLRWYVLDFESQLSDPAFNPQAGEGVVYIPVEIYREFGKSEHGYPALDDIQAYIEANG